MRHWKLLLSIFLAIAIITTLYFITGNLKASDLTESTVSDFSYEGFESAEDLTSTNRLIAENDNFKLHINEITTHIAITDKESGEVWYSNPQTEDTATNVTPSTLNRHKSTLELTYANETGALNTINNYKYSIEHDQPITGISWPVNDIRSFEMKYIENGVQVYYTFKDISVDYLYFPKYITRETMALLKETLSSGSFSYVEATYKNINTEFDVYEIGSYESLSGIIIRRLYPIFYDIDPTDDIDVSLGYTREQAIQENALYNYFETIERPVFKIGIELTLTDDGLKASILKNSIVEPSNFKVANISLFPLFGTAISTEEGYIVLPDGSGAIMEFNNGKQYQSQYKKRLYGADLALLPYKMAEQQQKISLPVYGMIKENGGYAAIITAGDAMASINADVSGRVDSYNKVYPSFDFRKSERVTIGSGFQKYELDIWTKPRVDTDFSVEYRFISGDENSYVGVAHVFQEYLVDLGLTKKDTTSETVLNTELIGAYDKNQFFLGVPYSKIRSLTTFEEAQTIIDELYNNQVTNINVQYTGMMSGGVNASYYDQTKIENALGSKKDYNLLVDDFESKGITLFSSMNFMTTPSYRRLFQNFRYTSKRVSGKMALDFVYHFPSGLPYEEFNSTATFTAVNDSPYVINPAYYQSIYDKISKSDQFKALSLVDLGSTLAGSYNRDHPTYLQDSLYYQWDVLKNMTEKLNISNPLYFSMLYADSITNLPTEATLYSIIDYSVPFVQLVLSGFVDFSGDSLNMSAERNSQYLFLKAIETGSNLKYTLTHDSTMELLNSPYNYYMSTHYIEWMETIKAQVQEMNDIGIHNGYLVDHERLQTNVYRVTYSHGKTIILNYNGYPVTVSGVTISGTNYAVIT